MKAQVLRIPSDIYHASPRLSSSRIKDFAKSPRYYRETESLHREETDNQAFGTMGHCALLEPHKFVKAYLPVDLDRKGTKEWNSIATNNPDKIVVKRREYDAVIELVKSVRQNPLISRLLTTGNPETELTIYWQAMLGVEAKARLDLVADKSHIVDVKTCSNVEAFEKSVFNYKYHWQAAWYKRAAIAADIAHEDTPFYFVAVEPDAPFESRIYTLSQEIIDIANSEIDALLEEFSACYNANSWPDKTGPWEIKLPNYMRGNSDE
jgi:hypothetical protein